MGGTTSRFGDTEWDAVDGGIKDASETIDGAEPTTYHNILTLKKANIVNQRDFEIRDDLDKLLYTTQAINGTTKWFDLLDSEGKKIFCIQTDSLRSQWQVYSYIPVFEGQASDDEASSQLTNGDKQALYRKARIDITWKKSHGNVHLVKSMPSSDNKLGEFAEESCLKVEEIRSKTAQFQSFVPKINPVVDNVVHPPLCGWWVWENTPNLHQMKMHLSKGTDIALHCILAITTNLVSVEKKTDQLQ